MKTKQFSKKILGNKMDTRVMLHRISIKFYENGAVIKPIGKQGIAICEALEPQIENQNAMFLTNECLLYLKGTIRDHNQKVKLAEGITETFEEGVGKEEWARYMGTK
jgi:hypothetical protein